MIMLSIILIILLVVVIVVVVVVVVIVIIMFTSCISASGTPRARWRAAPPSRARTRPAAGACPLVYICRYISNVTVTITITATDYN